MSRLKPTEEHKQLANKLRQLLEKYGFYNLTIRRYQLTKTGKLTIGYNDKGHGGYLTVKVTPQKITITKGDRLVGEIMIPPDVEQRIHSNGYKELMSFLDKFIYNLEEEPSEEIQPTQTTIKEVQLPIHKSDIKSEKLARLVDEDINVVKHHIEDEVVIDIFHQQPYCRLIVTAPVTTNEEYTLEDIVVMSNESGAIRFVHTNPVIIGCNILNRHQYNFINGARYLSVYYELFSIKEPIEFTKIPQLLYIPIVLVDGIRFVHIDEVTNEDIQTLSKYLPNINEHTVEYLIQKLRVNKAVEIELKTGVIRFPVITNQTK
jgi:hypothetical protein